MQSVKTKQRVISLMLAVITIFSCFTAGTIPGYAYTIQGNGLGGSKYMGGSGSGTFSPIRSGVRIYFINQETGQRASNVVDIVNQAELGVADYYVTIDKIKTDTNYDGTYWIADNYTDLGVAMNDDRELIDRHRILFPGTVTEWYANGDGSIIAGFPAQIMTDGKWAGRGKELKDWMLGTKPPIVQTLGGGGSAGDSIDNTTLGEYDGQDIDAKTIEDQINDIQKRLDNSLEIALKQMEEGKYTQLEVRNLIAEKAAQFIDNIVTATDKDGNMLYDDDEVIMLNNTIRQYLSSLEDRIQSSSSGNSEKLDDTLESANWLLNQLIDTAYATEGVQEKEGMTPLYSDNHIVKFLEVNGKSGYLFNLVPSQCPKGKWISNTTGKYGVIGTASLNGLVIIMEPLILSRLQANKSSASQTSWAFFGTPHELGLLLESEKNKPDGFRNGDSSGHNYPTRGGWLAQATHLAFPWSMYTDEPLELGSMTIKAGIDLKNDKSSLFTNSQGTIRHSRLCYDSELADSTWGLGMHFYILGDPGGPPGIPTYDSYPHDPTKTPDHKVNKTPHPAPDPDPNDPGWIPLAPGEDPENYKETSRTVNIVKVYDTRILETDSSGERIIRHDHTFTRVNCPGDISIQHEPDYKVVGWFTSQEYYGELMGWDTDPSTIDPTEWDELKAVILDKTELDEWELEKVKGKKEMEEEKRVKIAASCDCDKEKDPDTIDGEHGKHYHDTTLYVHLLKEEKIPETSTYDEPDHTPSGTPPAVPPHPSQDPHEPEDPNFDPETDHVEDDDPYCHYRIVKVYETITVTDEGEQPPESDGVFVTYKTNPIVQIEDEAQSSDPFDGSWHLTDWCVSDTYNNVPPPDLWKPITDPLPKKQSGTGETKVDLIDKNDREKEVTLYVHLVRKIKEGNPIGAIIIQQSQISKTIHTNDSHIGGYFGDYTFQFYEGAFKKNHTTYFDHCCVGGDHRYHSCRCLGHICAHAMRGSDGDDHLDFAFDLMSGQDELEIKKGIHSDIDPKVYGKGGSAFGALKDGNYLHYPKTLTSLDREDFTFPGDGNDGEGAEYVTILWRGTSKYKDIPTLALYKKKDITEVYGADNYTIPDKLLSSAGSTANRKSNKKRASQYWVGDLKFTFGLEGHEDRSDRLGISSCINIGGNQCIDYDPKYVGTYDQFTYDFEAGVAIRFYAGKQIGLQAAPFGSKSTTPILEDQIGKHKERNVIQCKQEIKFYPYIRMTYMLNKLKDAEDEEANTDAAGYVNDVRKDTYVLSEHESSVLPSDAVIVQWEKGRNDENLLLTSQQWSVHQKAVSGSGGWQGKNQVLPGGAIYQLSTPKEDWVTVNLITYQTIVDDKARNEYLTASNTLTGDEYKVKKVAEDHLSFVNDAKEVLDNLKVVQWVNKNVGASTAWTNDFVAKPSNGIVKILDGIEISSIDLSGLRGGSKTHPNDDTKYYMRQQTQLSNYQEVKKLSEWTKTIDDAQGIKEQPFEGDLDVFNVRHKNTVYKLFTDTSGNVYLAKLEKIYSANDTAMDSTETDIQNMVDAMKDLNGDTLSTKTGGATITKLCDKTVAGTAINGILTGDAKEIDDATFFITNFVSALNRNKGTDYTAEWVDGPTEGKWYNDAFDGVYLARQQTTFNVGFAFSASRHSALDPALDPQNKGQSDLYTSAFLSQFCVDSQSEAAIAQGKVKNYIGTFKDIDITMPDMESMYISKKFYVPNANVQDLN